MRGVQGDAGEAAHHAACARVRVWGGCECAERQTWRGWHCWCNRSGVWEIGTARHERARHQMDGVHTGAVKSTECSETSAATTSGGRRWARDGRRSGAAAEERKREAKEGDDSGCGFRWRGERRRGRAHATVPQADPSRLDTRGRVTHVSGSSDAAGTAPPPLPPPRKYSCSSAAAAEMRRCGLSVSRRSRRSRATGDALHGERVGSRCAVAVRRALSPSQPRGRQAKKWTAGRTQQPCAPTATAPGGPPRPPHPPGEALLELGRVLLLRREHAVRLQPREAGPRLGVGHAAQLVDQVHLPRLSVAGQDFAACKGVRERPGAVK